MPNPDVLPYSNYPLSEYKKGAIVSLTLENFMKHQQATFRFTPGLNFIFGLNGSGKSSIVCALILGHGGDPKITGRCPKISQYVTSDKDYARIKIELSNGDGAKITTLERTIIIKKENNGTVNEYRVDKKRVTLEEFRETVFSFNISVDNLCQVLPQERVAEFSGLNSQELLLQTEQSIGDVELYNDHKKLIQSDKNIRTFENSIKQTEVQIATYKGFKNALEPAIEKINQSSRYQREIDILEKKLVFLAFNKARQAYIFVKEKFDKSRQEVLTFRVKVDESKKQYDRFEKLLSTYYEKISLQKKNLDGFTNMCERVHGTNGGYRKEKSEIITNYKEAQENYSRCKETLECLKEEIERETERLEQLDQMNSNIDEEFKRLTAEIKKFEEIKQQIGSLKEQKNIVRGQEGAAKRSIKTMQERKEENLKKFFKSATLEANRIYLENKSKFEGKVFNILITHIRPKKPEYSKYFERAIPSRDWEMFLFEKRTDLEAFRNILEKSSNRIKIPMALIPELEDDLLYTQFNVDDYRSKGVIGSLHDLYDSPKLVKAYLNKTARLNLHPVCDERGDSHIESFSRTFRNLYTLKNFYSFVRSRFQQDIIVTTIDELKAPRVLNMLSDIDLNEVKRYEEIIHKAQQEYCEIESKIKELDQMVIDNEPELDRLKEEKIKIQKNVKTRETYVKTIQEKTAKLNREQKEFEKMGDISIDMNKMNESFDRHGGFIDGFIKALDRTTSNVKERFSLTQEYSIIEPFKSHYYSEYLQSKKNAEEYENKLRSLNQEKENAKNQASEKLAEASEKAGVNFKNKDDPEVKELVTNFDKYPENHDEIEAKLMSYKSKCEVYQGNNEEILQQYKEYSEKIVKSDEDLKKLHEKIEDEKKSISSIKDSWISRLKTIVSKINENFSTFMEKLSYKGIVDLAQFGDGEDINFEQCGISIRVKFRENSSFSDLQSHSQSGGERSVATVVYMLALQEQAVVPFRIIDEINQGMDANNERNVFGLFDYVAKTNQSQYFLLTPKIISGLAYTEQMSVINILAFGAPDNN